jgi:integrase
MYPCTRAGSNSGGLEGIHADSRWLDLRQYPDWPTVLGHALQDSHLKQAGERIGIEILGWHNFRHTHRKMAKDLGTSIEVQQAMMRHTTPAMTMKYGKEDSMLEIVRPANTKIVEMLKKISGF